MRLSLRNVLVAAAALCLAASASAQITAAGFPVTDDCSTGLNNATTDAAELYAIKVVSLTAGDPGTDWLVDTTTKAGASIGLAAVSDPGYIVPPNWTIPDGVAHDVHVFLTYANGKIVTDSGKLGDTLGAFDLSRGQTVGVAPTGILASTGFSPSGSINLGGAGAVQFPVSGKKSVMAAMSPVIEVNSTDVGGCAVGGIVDGDPGDTTETKVGLIIGYNVYRVPGVAGTPPSGLTAAQYISNWAYTARIDGMTMTTQDPGGTGTGTPPRGDNTNAPTDGAADTDLTGWENLDNVPYNGNEVVIFSDQPLNPDNSGRAGGIAGPDPTGVQGYWYAFQPLVAGKVSSFQSASINAQPASDHRLDVDGDTVMESVDLDGVAASPEFISPQAQHLTGPAPATDFGLGLTYKGVPIHSPWAFGKCDPTPARTGVTFNASVGTGGVNITFSAALEAGNVLGFNVYRVDGDTKSKVNDQIIAARGGEGSVYSLVDTAEGTSRRVRRDSTLQYVVEVVYNDGTPALTVGPFAVVTERGGSTRRSR